MLLGVILRVPSTPSGETCGETMRSNTQTHTNEQSNKTIMRQNLFLTFVAMTMAVCPGAMAQSGQTPTDGSSYYIRNVYTNQYLCQDGKGRVMLSASGTPLTLQSAKSNVGTYYLLDSSDTLSATVPERLLSNGGMYEEWTFTAAENGTYNVALRNSGVNAYTYLEYSALTGDVLRNPLAPSASDQKAQWEFVSANDYVVPTLTLKEDTTSYSRPIGTFNVVFQRSLALNMWNTLCCPFPISEEQLKEQFGKDCVLLKFRGATNGTIDFTPVDSAEAGIPYLLWPTKAASDNTNYRFDNVSGFAEAPTDVRQGGITFIGTFVKGTVPARAYVWSQNKLYHLISEMDLYGFRSYMWEDATGQSKLSNWTIGGSTAIDGIVESFDTKPYDIYNLNGQKVKTNATSLDGLPSGLYIVNGKKVVKR